MIKGAIQQEVRPLLIPKDLQTCKFVKKETKSVTCKDAPRETAGWSQAQPVPVPWWPAATAHPGGRTGVVPGAWYAHSRGLLPSSPGPSPLRGPKTETRTHPLTSGGLKGSESRG